jgi:glycosyltransferase involved in cell wall biosynthesis
MFKVLHVISGLKVGGAEMALLRLIVSSQGGSYQHSVVALSPGGGMLERFDECGIEVIQLDFKRRPISAFGRLFGLLRTLRPDVVQTWMYHADLLGGIAARLAGNSNVIWGVRTTDVNANGGAGIRALRRICAILSSYLPKIIVCAAEASRNSHVDVGYAENRMVVIPNGFDFSRFQIDETNRLQFREKVGFDNSMVVVGTLGRFNLAKDPENFVRAAGLVAKTWPNIRFMMVGRDFVQSNGELARWIKETGYSDRFVLLGERADVPACLAAMDIFCLTSRTEGFPNVLAEAMAMQLPTVTTDVGDAGVLVAQAGLVVPKEEPQALAAALNTVLTMNIKQRRALGHAASERVRNEFSLDQMRFRFESIYEALIKNDEGFN